MVTGGIAGIVDTPGAAAAAEAVPGIGKVAGIPAADAATGQGRAAGTGAAGRW
jgi:hypothetical protein